MKKFLCIAFVLLFLLGLAACNTATYEQISAEEAKRLMDTETDYIIIDARTEEEFAQGHIENAILIPEYEIANRAEDELPQKDALILVYCRSGRRSKIASEELVKLGYTNVKEFGGMSGDIAGFQLQAAELVMLALVVLTERIMAAL